MGLLKGLEALGLGKMMNVDIYADEKEEAEKKKTEVQKPAVKTVNEADLVLDKTFKCPVCDKTFKSKMVKTGKARLVAQDMDLRPKYSDIDSLKYDVIVCPICGYASLPRTFSMLTLPQGKLIRENISMSFTGIPGMDGEIYDYDTAITRCRLALVNTVVKKGKLSERAYVCLELAWLLRGKRETLPDDTPDKANVAAQLEEEEKEMLVNAKEGFINAFAKERFPLYSLDENTATYIVAALSAETGDKENALRWASRIIGSTAANDRIKERARNLRDSIKDGEN